MRKTVYLCGPINGCTDAQAADWREAVKTALAGRYDIKDPMNRDYRGRESEPEIPEQIVEADKADIRESDIVLAMARRPSWGTAMEILYADEHGKTVLAINDAPTISPWLACHSSRVFSTLGGALVHLIREDE